MVTSIASVSSHSDSTVVLSQIASKMLLIRLCEGATRSRSAPGRSPGIISTTDTLVPSAAYTVPISRRMQPPPITSMLPGISVKSRAALESIMRGLSSFSAGRTAGREPVAMMMRSKLAVSSAPPLREILSVFELTNAARPCT